MIEVGLCQISAQNLPVDPLWSLSLPVLFCSAKLASMLILKHIKSVPCLRTSALAIPSAWTALTHIFSSLKPSYFHSVLCSNFILVKRPSLIYPYTNPALTLGIFPLSLFFSTALFSTWHNTISIFICWLAPLDYKISEGKDFVLFIAVI